MKEDEDEDEDIEEEEGEEVLPFGQGSESGSGEDEESTSDGEGGLSSSKVKPKNRASKSNGTNGHNSHLDKDSRDMLQELKKASTADMEKGRDVRKQLVNALLGFLKVVCSCLSLLTIHQSFWDTLLEARIRLQKCVTSAHVLPDVSELVDFPSIETD